MILRCLSFEKEKQLKLRVGVRREFVSASLLLDNI